jgi:DHA1 family bicyclomycin/chloramphenicol resistance-like MFS transporter
MLGGTVLAVGSSSVMLAGHQLVPASVLVLILPMTFSAMSLGLTLPHAMAIALRPFPHIAGSASALLGFVQMGIAALVTAFVGRVLVDSPLPLLQCMLAVGAAAAVLSLWVHRRRDALAGAA